MEQNSTTKIVSLHMERCTYNCPNSSVCYHKKKILSSTKSDNVLPINFRVQMLNLGYTIHESLCSVPDKWVVSLLSKYPNYNITLPYTLLTKEVKAYKNQIQVTVYDLEQTLNSLEFQKLYLLKDVESFKYSVEKGLWSIPFSRIHFCIDQGWLSKDKFQVILYHRMRGNSYVSLDSCAESWIINGQCPYGKGNYVDITFDGTLRCCPFNTTGIPLKSVFNGDYSSLFKITCAPEKCKYSELFHGEKIDGTK